RAPQKATRPIAARGGHDQLAAGVIIAIAAPCGSPNTAKRPTPGTSVGGTCTVPPSFLARASAASQSSTPTYGSHIGGTSLLGDDRMPARGTPSFSSTR